MKFECKIRLKSGSTVIVDVEGNMKVKEGFELGAAELEKLLRTKPLPEAVDIAQRAKVLTSEGVKSKDAYVYSPKGRGFVTIDEKIAGKIVTALDAKIRSRCKSSEEITDMYAGLRQAFESANACSKITAVERNRNISLSTFFAIDKAIFKALLPHNQIKAWWKVAQIIGYRLKQTVTNR